MFDYSNLFDVWGQTTLGAWLEILPSQLEGRLVVSRHGDLERWKAILARLPDIRAGRVHLDGDIVRVGGSDDIDATLSVTIESSLRALQPWRKGPYRVHGVHIDAEWRSDLKWRRFCDHIQPLSGRTVLDVGSGNGYHCWRMKGAGAKLVVGIDPSLLSVMQFHAIKRFAGDWPVYVLPLGIEDVPAEMKAFDTVFSMGVLYHRRSPMDHLLELRGCLRPGGELVLETLVVAGEQGRVLVPEGRYAQMRNVWFIPSCPTLMAWLRRCGYRGIRLIDVTATTPREQRSTDWMRFQSLPDFLDPQNPQLTREGLPAPVRAIFLAESP